LLTRSQVLAALIQESRVWSWREELKEIVWLAFIVGGLSVVAVTLAVAVAVV
jgi:hypothetical protein